jgi:hypothetical protein
MPKTDLEKYHKSSGEEHRHKRKFWSGEKKNAQTACKICLLFFKRVQGLVLIQAAHLLSV